MKVHKKLFGALIVTAIHLYLLKWVLDAFGIRSFAFAFLSNWLIVSWVALVGQLVFFRFGPGYYRIRPFEQDGRLYERMGIRLFQKLVGRGPWAVLNPTLRFSRSRAQLASLEEEMCKAEAGHLLAFLMVTVAAGFAVVRGWPDAAGWLMLFNIPLNLYPVMLQRRNRAHVQRISGRLAVLE